MTCRGRLTLHPSGLGRVSRPVWEAGDDVAAVKRTPGVVVIDAKSIYVTIDARNHPVNISEKRTALELLAYLENTTLNGTETRWVHG